MLAVTTCLREMHSARVTSSMTTIEADHEVATLRAALGERERELTSLRLRLAALENASRKELAGERVRADRRSNAVVDESEVAPIIRGGKFRSLADAMPQMVWSTRPDGYHDYFNRPWYDFTGVPQGSTDGEEWNGMFHPEDQERAWARWRRSLTSGEPYEIEYRLKHHSGEYRWVLGRALPVRGDDGNILRWFGTCTDVDEFKRAAEALRANEEFTRRVLDSSGDCIKVLSLDGAVEFISGGGLTVMEVDDFSAIEGCDWRGFWDGPERESACAALETAKAGRTGRFQGYTPTLKGTPKWWDVIVTPINGANGRPERVLSISRDITETKRHEETLELLNREMDHRIKNLFAIATSLTSLAARQATTPKELADDLRARFGTLARVHSFIRTHTTEVAPPTHGALVRALLEPYHAGVGAEGRVQVECLGVPVGPQSTTAIALIIHELATNAAKYGALSTPDGRLRIGCSSDETTAILVWHEEGGPTVTRPANGEGFGSTLVRRSIADQLNGSLETEWDPAGIKVTIRADRERLAG